MKLTANIEGGTMNKSQVIVRAALVLLACEIAAPTVFSLATTTADAAPETKAPTASIAEPYIAEKPVSFVETAKISTQRAVKPCADKTLALDEIVAEYAKNEPQRNERYVSVEMSDDETELLAKIIWLEARGECEKGQQAVAEVVLNRVISGQFPNTVYDVLRERGQFETWGSRNSASPTETQYNAIYNALYGELILDEDVVFFATRAENKNVWGTIGGHTFCRAYNY